MNVVYEIKKELIKLNSVGYDTINSFNYAVNGCLMIVDEKKERKILMKKFVRIFDDKTS